MKKLGVEAAKWTLTVVARGPMGLCGAAQPAELEYKVELRGPQPEKGSAPKLLETSATGKSGETIVLGASRMHDSSRAMIVLLTGKLLS